MNYFWHIIRKTVSIRSISCDSESLSILLCHEVIYLLRPESDTSYTANPRQLICVWIFPLITIYSHLFQLLQPLLWLQTPPPWLFISVVTEVFTPYMNTCLFMKCKMYSWQIWRIIVHHQHEGHFINMNFLWCVSSCTDCIYSVLPGLCDLNSTWSLPQKICVPFCTE